MIVTAWNNGQYLESGAGYGTKIRITDRDKYFDRHWKTVLLELDGEGVPIEVNIGKPSFWNDTCHELISHHIGLWLRSKGMAPWPKGRPPKLVLEPLGDNRFVLKPV